MILILLLIISLVTVALFRFSFLDPIHPLVQKAHMFCIQQLPVEATALPELKALVCAENFSSLSQSQLYISSGLIHLFVVSGAHLALLEAYLLRAPLPRPFQRPLLFVVLIFYGFMCSLNPPITRSLLSLLTGFYLSTKNITWPQHFHILVSGVFCLIFNFSWINSLSLQMSWIAALVITGSASWAGPKSVVLRQSLFFTLLLPTVVFFQIPSLSVVLTNILLAPFLELVLFPLGLAVWLCGFLHPVFDLTIELFRSLLKLFEADFQYQLKELPTQLTFFNWVLIFVLHSMTQLFHVYTKRRADA